MQDTNVFGPYFDGEKNVYADPMTIGRNLEHKSQSQFYGWLRIMRETGPADTDGDTEETKAANAARRQQIEARALEIGPVILAVVRDVFGMMPFDTSTGKGATERQCHEVLTAWFTFLAAEPKGQEPEQAA